MTAVYLGIDPSWAKQRLACILGSKEKRIDVTEIRLGVQTHQTNLPTRLVGLFGKRDEMTEVKLSHRPGAQGDGCLQGMPAGQKRMTEIALSYNHATPCQVILAGRGEPIVDEDGKMTTIRLSHDNAAQGEWVLKGKRGGAESPPELERYLLAPHERPAILISYFYLGDDFLACFDREYQGFRSWALDSGAFSAKNSGKNINLGGYIESCKRLNADPVRRPAEIFALDVIGDHQASAVNTKKMWAAGVEAIPAFHHGEPWDVLVGLCKDYPKVAIGGIVGMRPDAKERFIAECFSRVWPKLLHGFGVCHERILMKFPFHSVDATNWEIAPCKYGAWKSLKGVKRASWRGSAQNLKREVLYYLELEKRVTAKWGAVLAKVK